MVSHIKDCHHNVKGLAKKQDRYTCFHKKADKNRCIEIMQVVFVNDHGDQFIDEYKADDHTRYGNHHVIGQGFYHVKNAGVPCAGSQADFPCNRAYFCIHIRKHGFEVRQHPSLQQFLYELSNFLNDPSHKLGKQTGKLWNHRLRHNNNASTSHKLLDSLGLCLCVIKKQ